MATTRAQDRLQPALLDRLCDDDPTSKVEPTEARVIGRDRLRELVLRDLAWLLNTTAPREHIDWTAYPEARQSMLNFGLPALSGLSTSSIDPEELRLGVKQAILDHEPRILPGTLGVEVVMSESQMDHHNLIGFRISGQLWAQPVPMELLLQTDVDLETGHVAVRELDR